MDFQFDGEDYRVMRGVGTQVWLLMHNFTDHRGWRLVGQYPAKISDSKIIAHAKKDLANEPK